VIKLFGEEYSYTFVSLCLSIVASFLVGTFIDMDTGMLWASCNIIAGIAMIIWRMDKNE